jgi:threonine aldolase
VSGPESGPGVTSQVDLRSDTVTRPSAGMRAAMASARVGDDAFGDDPTVRLLEERVAALLGQESALFVPSGIMGNQLALGVLGRPGTEVIMEEGSHIGTWEEGAPSALWGLQLRPVPGDGGVPRLEAVRAAARGETPFLSSTSILAIENSHLASGGRVMPISRVEPLVEVARSVGASVHLDGARLWNAAAAAGCAPGEWGSRVDTVMVSLSKGLGCPAGALLAGAAPVIRDARRLRRRLGGQMRQVGVLAAAGLYALDHNVERLHQDHALARELARGASGLPGLRVTMPETNVVLLEPAAPARPEAMVDFLKDHGILTTVFGRTSVRAVTHMDVDRAGIKRVIELLESVAAGSAGPGWMA